MERKQVTEMVENVYARSRVENVTISETLIVLGVCLSYFSSDSSGERVEAVEPVKVGEAVEVVQPVNFGIAGMTLPQAYEFVDKLLIKNALENTNGNKSQSAKVLGISRAGLLNKLKKYEIEDSLLEG